jgi:succinate-semialdehyde dehydrogenase/glutarate-semialdehyde dehydrogenase
MRERQLFIDGRWRPAQNGQQLAINDPATGEPVGPTALAGAADIDAAVQAAERLSSLGGRPISTSARASWIAKPI